MTQKELKTLIGLLKLFMANASGNYTESVGRVIDLVNREIDWKIN